MDDMISRTKLLNDLSYCPPELWQDDEYIKAKIIRQPAVNAVPVEHGRWTYFNCVGRNGRYQCSECFHWVNPGTDRNYCPNCGAKMDGERRG